MGKKWRNNQKRKTGSLKAAFGHKLKVEGTVRKSRVQRLSCWSLCWCPRQFISACASPLPRSLPISKGEWAVAASVNSLIQVTDLQKYYNKGAIKALDGVTVNIEKGDVMVVIGPSGSGKSTFLRSLNLMEEPTGGAITCRFTSPPPKSFVPWRTNNWPWCRYKTCSERIY